jgi:DNA repair protein RadC
MFKKQSFFTDDSVSEISVSYSTRINTEDRITVCNSQTAHRVFYHVWDLDKMELQESFKVMLLNRRNQVLGVVTIADGGIAHAQVDIRLLLGVALKAAAVNIILAHNHPSGAAYPSNPDKALSQKIFEAASLMDITVLDHIILTHDGYFSFTDDGLLPVSYCSTTKQEA